MTNTFGQHISDGMLLVSDEYERWINNPSEDKDVRPLAKAAAAHLKLGAKLPVAELAPCLAILYFHVTEFDSAWLPRVVIQLFAWILRVTVYRGRPMWNDFYMSLWQLSRDERYVQRLHSHLKHANPMQLHTGQWMVNSVCQQDEEFCERWQQVVKAEGEVFA